MKQTIVKNSPLVRVLIVEDHDLSAHIAQRFLQDLGCEVDCVSDGDSALKLFKDQLPPYDLVLMDISLPGIDGYELAEKLNKILLSKVDSEHDPIHIVALTARSSAENKQRCLSAGMSEVLDKPLLKATALNGEQYMLMCILSI
jgi:CheY-like chemotaxis protein